MPHTALALGVIHCEIAPSHMFYAANANLVGLCCLGEKVTSRGGPVLLSQAPICPCVGFGTCPASVLYERPNSFVVWCLNIFVDFDFISHCFGSQRHSAAIVVGIVITGINSLSDRLRSVIFALFRVPHAHKALYLHQKSKHLRLYKEIWAVWRNICYLFAKKSVTKKWIAFYLVVSRW